METEKLKEKQATRQIVIEKDREANTPIDKQIVGQTIKQANRQTYGLYVTKQHF